MLLSKQVEELATKLEELANIVKGENEESANLNLKTTEKLENEESLIHSSLTFDSHFKKNKLIAKTNNGALDKSGYEVPINALSPKSINIMRKSQTSSKVLGEKISLNKKRYDYKMAKNNSVDTMGCLSQGYESTDNNYK